MRGLDRYVRRSIDSKDRLIKGRELSKITNADGYYQVKLCKNNISKPYRVHRLVAETFLPNPNNFPEINHIDCKRANNCVENLEWCDHHSNVLHSAKLGKYQRFGDKNPNFGNHTLHEKYSINPNLAVEKLSRPREQNGRAKRVQLYDGHMRFVSEFNWIGGCAEYLIRQGFTYGKVDSIRANISLAIRKNKMYLNHYYRSA